MQPVPTVTLGRPGFVASRLGLGTAPLAMPELFGNVAEEQAQATVRAALERGGRFFDTAPFYGAGGSEQRLGRALAGVPRDRYVLASKVGRLITAAGGVVFNYSRDGILRSVEDSLRRLQVDRIDILHIHDPDDHYRQALTEAFPTLADLRSQGVIKAVGAGMNQWQMLADLARHADFDCFLLAGRYTLLEQTALGFLSRCQSKGIHIFLGGVHNSGILATGPRPGARYNYAPAPPGVLERAGKLAAACARHGVALGTAALQFAAAHPAVAVTLTGAAAPAELEQNIAALQAPIPAALWAELRAEGLLDPAAPTPAA